MNIKIPLVIFMSLFVASIFSQEASEIYLFELVQTETSYELNNPINISNNPGYDNQPAFTLDGESVLFTSFRDNQADIALYDIKLDFRKWLTDTPENEVSPLPYPDKKKWFTAAKSDSIGHQKVFQYTFKQKPPKPLFTENEIVYYDWYDKSAMICFIAGDTDALFIKNFKYDILYPIQQNIGRSFQRIPGTDLIGFINYNHEVPEIYRVHPKTNKLEYIVDALEGSEDLAFTNNRTIFMAKGNQIFKFRPEQDKDWMPVKINSDIGLKNITRLTISPDGTKMAVVAAE
ncbi:hypothetical protein [Namhaeicola litoreus]|uniref:WD40-like Beta Propeller Repeat n=1 Tax=Namhaeicola litoreus TaxID=1052145 RepID=A0ABW3Y649_9FLAO